MFSKCVLYFVLVVVSESQNQNLTRDQDESYDTFLENQDRLTKDLFKNYNPDFTTIYTLHSSKSINSSGYNHPPPLNLNFKCRMLKLIDVVEKEEKVTFLVDFLAEWQDRRLRWNPKDYDGIEHFYTLQKNIWIPEITIADAHNVIDFQPESQKIAWINSNGTVGFYVSAVVSVICQLDVYKFPRDIHTCSVNVMFHSYFKNEYKITNQQIDLSQPISELGNGEFQILSINTSTLIADPRNADIQKVNVTFQRNPGFYIALVIIPALFINVLSILAVFVNIENIPEKFTIGLTNVMAMTFVLSILADDLPKTKKPPLLAIYVIISLVIIVAAICLIFNTHGLSVDENISYRRFLSEQKRLFKNLFEDYDADISALYTLTNSSFVDEYSIHPPKLTLYLQCRMIKLIDVVEKEEKVTFLFDYVVQWQDIRLQWDPNDYGGITHIYVQQKNIWIPEITLSDAHDVIDFQTDQQKTAWVYYNGSIGFYTSSVPSVICQMDVFKFPMDSHICSVNIQFHTYLLDEYKMINQPVNIPQPVGYLGNGEWKVEWVNATMWDTEGVVADIQQVQVKIKRNPGFYIALVIIPAFFINILTVFALFYKIEALPEKFSLGLTNIMAMTFIIAILADDLPKTKQIPLLAIYVIVSLVITIFSLFSIIILVKIKKFKCYEGGQKLKFEYVLMFVFQLANFVNFIVLFF